VTSSRMTENIEKYEKLAEEYRKEANKDFDKVAVIGAVLILFHFLDVHPDKINGMGLTFPIASPIIVKGSIGIIFFYFLIRLRTNNFFAKTLTNVDRDGEILRRVEIESRQYIRNKSRYRKIALQIKSIRDHILKISSKIFIVAFLIVTITFASYDTWNLVIYAGTNAPLAKRVRCSLTFSPVAELNKRGSARGSRC